MNNVELWIGLGLAVLTFVAGRFVSFYDFAKREDPKLVDGENTQHIYTIAKWLVADQDRHKDKAGDQKFTDAWKKLHEDTGAPEAVAKGAIQYAVDQKKKDESVESHEIKASDISTDLLPEIEVPKVTEPVVEQKEVIPPAQPVEDKIIDDLG